MKKNANPYVHKHAKKRRRITRKQWIAIISLVGVIAIVAGIMVVGNLSNASIADPHAGHNHAPGEDCNTTPTGGHYEGDGHNHGAPTNTANAKIKHQIYVNADKTYRLVFRDTAGKTLAEFDNIPKQPMTETVDAAKGIYSLAWATASGPNDYEQVYYNTLTGAVSEKFYAPRGTDGVRIAYSSPDQKSILVQDLFDKKVYYKEHPLKDAVEKKGNIIISGKLQADRKTVLISYCSSDSDNYAYANIPLYE